jgi:DNA-binding transcriptional MerR regulator
MKTYYRSGEIARLCGVSPDTIRHYERLGLVAQARRSENGYREYAPETLTRVRTIQSALHIGFTLKELSRVFRVRDKGGVPCHEVRDLARRKLAETATRIQELKDLQKRLESLLKTWEESLKQTPQGMKAELLHSIALQEGVRHETRRSRRQFK